MKRSQEEFAKIIHDDLFPRSIRLHIDLVKSDREVTKMAAIAIADSLERWPNDFEHLQKRYEKYLCKGCGRYYDCNCEEIPTVEDTILTMTLIELDEVPESVVKSWSDQERIEVCHYVGAIHLSASDNPDVEIPSIPEVLKPYIHWSF